MNLKAMFADKHSLPHLVDTVALADLGYSCLVPGLSQALRPMLGIGLFARRAIQVVDMSIEMPGLAECAMVPLHE